MFAFDYLFDLFTRFVIPQTPLKGLFYVAILLFFDYYFSSNPQKIFKNISVYKKQFILVIMLSFILGTFFVKRRRTLYIFNFNYAQNYPIQFFGYNTLFSVEVAFKLKYYQDKLFFPSNKTSPTEKYIALWDNLSSSANAEILNSKRLFLIGRLFF